MISMFGKRVRSRRRLPLQNQVKQSRIISWGSHSQLATYKLPFCWSWRGILRSFNSVQPSFSSLFFSRRATDTRKTDRQTLEEGLLLIWSSPLSIELLSIPGLLIKLLTCSSQSLSLSVITRLSLSLITRRQRERLTWVTDEPILSCCFSWCGVPPDAMMTGDKTRGTYRNPINFIVSRSECRLLARHNTSFCVKYSTIQSSFPSRTEQPSFAT